MGRHGKGMDDPEERALLFVQQYLREAGFTQGGGARGAVRCGAVRCGAVRALR